MSEVSRPAQGTTGHNRQEQRELPQPSFGGAAAQRRAAGWGEEAGYVCLEKAPSIMGQQLCPPGCWASSQTLYLQLAEPGKPCQAPWERII